METQRHEQKPLGLQVAMVELGAIGTPLYAALRVTAMAQCPPWRNRFFTTMRGFEEKARRSEVVAEVFARIERAPHSLLRNTVTLEAKLLPFLRWLPLPGACWPCCRF